MDPEVEQSYIQKLKIVENLQEDVNMLKGKTRLQRHINVHCYTYLMIFNYTFIVKSNI